MDKRLMMKAYEELILEGFVPRMDEDEYVQYIFVPEFGYIDDIEEIEEGLRVTFDDGYVYEIRY